VKRKRISAPRPATESLISETIVPERLLEEAKRAIESDRLRKIVLCTVCKSECAPNSTENLCWVCRRLKLSAWRDSDSQMPAQE
jgi:hypothetical protein